MWFLLKQNNCLNWTLTATVVQVVKLLAPDKSLLRVFIFNSKYKVAWGESEKMDRATLEKPSIPTHSSRTGIEVKVNFTRSNLFPQPGQKGFVELEGKFRG